MKRCPTCQSTYTNDALRFCLQDGATLVSVSDASSNPAASEETLEISGGQIDLSQEPSNPHAAATVRIPAPAPTAVEQQSFRPPSSPEPQPSQGGAPPRQTNTVLVAGVTTIAVLLLVLVGIGIALLMRGRSDGRRNRTSETNANTSTRSDNVGPETAENANQQGRARRPDMTGELSSQASRVEAKILRGSSVSQSDIAGLSRAELRRLRNTVYARHGRIFERMELQQYFDGRPWYRKRADYTDDQLTPVDRDNINLIRAAEDRAP